jgi:hypothetical protein
VYRAATALAEQGGQTVSIDEMTGIQALERAARSLPMKPGHVERREFEYIRHGTKALIAAFDVATGTVRGTIGDTRTEDDFVAFMKDLFASASPVAPWRVVCDNLNTHMSEGVARLVAELCGIEDDLGEKGKSASRRLFSTSDASDRVRKRPLPLHCQGQSTNIRLMFQAMVTSLHSPRTRSIPRSMNCRKPITDLMIPNTGSGICLRKAYRGQSVGCQLNNAKRTFGERINQEPSVSAAGQIIMRP